MGPHTGRRAAGEGLWAGLASRELISAASRRPLITPPGLSCSSGYSFPGFPRKHTAPTPLSPSPCLSTYLSVSVSLCFSLCLSMSVYLPTCALPVCLSLSVSVCVCLSVSLSKRQKDTREVARVCLSVNECKCE